MVLRIQADNNPVFLLLSIKSACLSGKVWQCTRLKWIWCYTNHFFLPK